MKKDIAWKIIDRVVDTIWDTYIHFTSKPLVIEIGSEEDIDVDLFPYFWVQEA